MKKVKPNCGMMTAVVMLGLTPLLAQAQDHSTSLELKVSHLLTDRYGAYEISDIDQDGDLEAIVTYLDECTNAGCLFSVVDRGEDGNLAEVAYQYGEAPELVSEGTVIDANGIYFNWTGHTLRPYFDRYEELEFYSGSAQDKALIVEAAPWLSNMRHYDIQIANVDLLGDTAPERFAWLDGSEYSIAQMQPYFVISSDGEIITDGAFMDRPYLFPLHDRKAAALITYNGSEYETKIME